MSYQLDAFLYLATKGDQEAYKVQFTRKELKERLTPQEYHVTQEKGTERCVLCTTFLMGGSWIKHILNTHLNARIYDHCFGKRKRGKIWEFHNYVVRDDYEIIWEVLF